ncbi:MAG: glycosyl hydrolase [Myxococcota bacterium]
MNYRKMRSAGLGMMIATSLGCGSSVPGAEEPPTDAGMTDGTETRDAAGATDMGLGPIERMLAMIERDVDPSYVYEYEGARFVPPEGRTLLVLGQTLDGIDAHVESFPDEPGPGGWAAYWGIPSMDGVDREIVTEEGSRHNHQELVERFPNTALQSGLWMVGTWDVARRTADGEFDAIVRDFSTWAKTVARPIYLRIGYEFDGPHNELEPEDYIAAYRRIVDITREEGVENVAFVWHSYAAAPYDGNPISAWYPGGDYVDWVAVSLFGQSYASSPGRFADDVFEFARENRKPVMIAEASPIRGITAESTDAWDDWFANVFSLAYERNVKAISIINENWENFAGSEWEDARLQNNATIAEAFFAETSAERYLKQSDELFEQLGFAP